MGMESFLMHYGVSGQKWGIRRYQNEDGTLTEEGRARYLKSLDSHRQSVYNSLTDFGKQRVDHHLASGKDFDEAIRAGMQDTRKTLFTQKMLQVGAQIIGGYAAYKIGGKAAQRGHIILGSLLSGAGIGTMIGSTLGGAALAVGNAGTKKSIDDIDIDRDFVPVEKEKRRIGTRSYG